jgi:hypothetical protein
MSRIEDTLNLPKLSDALADLEGEDDFEDVDAEIEAATKQECAKAIKGTKDLTSLEIKDFMLAEHDQKMDEIATEAFTHHKTFMDLSTDVDPKNAEAFVAGAVQMLTLAMNARKDKIDKRMRLIKLKQDQERIDMLKGNTQEGVVVGEGGMVADRNELLEKFMNRDK